MHKLTPRCQRTTIWRLSTNVHIATCSPTCSVSKVRTATDSQRLRNYLKMYPCRSALPPSTRLLLASVCQTTGDRSRGYHRTCRTKTLLSVPFFSFTLQCCCQGVKFDFSKNKQKNISLSFTNTEFLPPKCRGNLQDTSR